MGGSNRTADEMGEVGRMPFVVEVLMSIGFQIILLLGTLNKLFFNPKLAGSNYKKKFKGLLDGFHEIYFYYVYRRVSDCSHFPVSSCAGAEIIVNERVTHDYGWTFSFTGEQRQCVNLGSFNYLGLVEHEESTAQEIFHVIDSNGMAMCSPSSELGRTALHCELEKLTANFLGVEDSVNFCAGFATNSMNIPAVLSKDCLVLSDEKNHASIINGAKLSDAKILKYRHTDTEDLEIKILENLSANQANGGRLFSKLFILTEGIYSVDGTIVDLPKIIELKKKYKAYLFIDDAHGVGILGQHGQGICEYHNVDPSDVDMIMGTYSKAFAANGGFIAGKKVLTNHLRAHSYACYGAAMPPAVVQKAICSIKALMWNNVEGNGNILVEKLRENTHYLRGKFQEEKLNVCGDKNSHIIPWIVGSVSATSFTIRELQKRGIAAAGVIYPATPLLAARLRFNISASHTKEQLDQVVNVVKEISHRYGLNYGKKQPNGLKCL